MSQLTRAQQEAGDALVYMGLNSQDTDPRVVDLRGVMIASVIEFGEGTLQPTEVELGNKIPISEGDA